MGSLLHVGTATTRGGLSTYEDWILDVLEADGHTVGAYFGYSDAEVSSGYDAVIVHARGAHGLGTKWRNSGIPALGTGRSDLVLTGGGWGDMATAASGSGNNMYYESDAQVTWTGQTVATAVNINAIGQKLTAATGLDADAVVMCKNTDSAGNPCVWTFNAGVTVDSATLTAKRAFLGLDSIYWQGGVVNSAGEDLLGSLVTWLLAGGSAPPRLLDRRTRRGLNRTHIIRASHY